MPNKTQECLNLAQQTAKKLTRYWENWTDYLTTASRLYKYSFADQLMIYAQRPDATACASFDIWNNRMNRYVRRGSKGIALLDQSSSVPRLHYVFDVSDTGVRRNSRDPEVWQLGPDLVQPVSEMIAREYGVYHERLSQQISDLTGKLVDSYWDNNSGDILDIVDGSFLIDYDEAGQEFQFKSAAAISILYTVLERCGLEPDGHFDRDDFQAIFSFSTPAAVYALGTAVSECSRDVLRNIERTVKTTIRRRNVERSQYEYEQQERDLLDRRGLPAPEPDPAPAGESTGQIRQTAPDLPDEASPGAVQFDGQAGELFSFYRIPKALFQEPRFQSLSTDAKTLYGILLDRMSLSAKNGWLDEQGRVFIIFTIEDVKRALCCADNKATKLLRELEEFGLIERKRRGLGKPSLVYVKNFSAESSKSIFQNRDFHDSGGFKSASQDPAKSRCNKTDENNTEKSETYPFYSEEEDGMSKREQLEEYFSQSLEVDTLLRLCPDDEDTIYQIVDLLVDTCTTSRKTLHIAGDDKPAEVVRSRFMKLNADHIQFVLKCLAENSSPID